MLHSMGSQSVGHDWVTEQQRRIIIGPVSCGTMYSFTKLLLLMGISLVTKSYNICSKDMYQPNNSALPEKKGFGKFVHSEFHLLGYQNNLKKNLLQCHRA